MYLDQWLLVTWEINLHSSSEWYFLWVFWFLGQAPSNFLSFPRKFDNPYNHSRVIDKHRISNERCVSASFFLGDWDDHPWRNQLFYTMRKWNCKITNFIFIFFICQQLKPWQNNNSPFLTYVDKMNADELKSVMIGMKNFE